MNNAKISEAMEQIHHQNSIIIHNGIELIVSVVPDWWLETLCIYSCASKNMYIGEGAQFGLDAVEISCFKMIFAREIKILTKT